MVGSGLCGTIYSDDQKMNRVVVTGVGCITPLGNNYEEVVSSMYAGTSAIKFNDVYQTNLARITVDIDSQFDRYDIASTDRFSRAAMLAYLQAKADAGITVDGVYIGTGAGATYEINRAILEYHEKQRVRPNSLVSSMSSGAASFIALRDNITGPVFTHSAACSSSSVSIGEAYKAIKHGEVNVMATGGSEFCISPLMIEQWRTMRALGSKSSPFGADRDGIILGEGSVIYILESLSHAINRGARIYAEIVGYGISCGSETITKPSEDSQVAAMKSAIKDIDAGRVTYINAHGTGTPVGDLVELSSIQRVFESGVPISSTKAIHGHLLGNAGAMEMIACLGVLASDQVIPNWNLTNPDTAIPEGTYLPTKIVKHSQDVCLNNSFAFGGTNVVLSLAKFIV
jgi:3-oxoacyl-(acyl-carrier-protein) synthase